MTEPTPPRRPAPWTLAAWSMVGLTSIALTVGVLTSIFSPTVVLDLLSLWPLAAIGLVVAVVGRFTQGSRLSSAGPLLIVTWLVLGLGLHLSAFPGSPSGSALVEADIGTPEVATLTVELGAGELVIASGPALAARPALVGGAIGAPRIQTAGVDPLGIAITADSSSRWFRFGRLDVAIPVGPTWSLAIGADSVDVELGDVDVAALTIDAERSQVSVGRPLGEMRLAITGDSEVDLPAGVPVVVEGEAVVPDGWVAVDGGWRSAVEAAEGEARIVIAVLAGRVTVTER